MRLAFLSKLAFVALAFGVAANAETIGNPLVPTTVTDTCTSCGFIFGQPFTTPGTLTSFSFYNNGTGGDITPLNFIGVAGGYELVGIGTTYTLSAGNPGGYLGAFGLSSGTASVGPDSYFGFENSTGSLVALSYTTPFLVNGGTAAYTPLVPLGTFIPVSGQTQDNYNQNLTRLYSIQATSTTPEPGTLSLVGTGLLGAASLIRRRFKK